MKTPISELRKRDSKKIYSQFASGNLSNVAGLDLDIDEPKNPDMLLTFRENLEIDELASEILKKVRIKMRS